MLVFIQFFVTCVQVFNLWEEKDQNSLSLNYIGSSSSCGDFEMPNNITLKLTSVYSTYSPGKLILLFMVLTSIQQLFSFHS